MQNHLTGDKLWWRTIPTLLILPLKLGADGIACAAGRVTQKPAVMFPEICVTWWTRRGPEQIPLVRSGFGAHPFWFSSNREVALYSDCFCISFILFLIITLILILYPLKQTSPYLPAVRDHCEPFFHPSLGTHPLNNLLTIPFLWNV